MNSEPELGNRGRRGISNPESIRDPAGAQEVTQLLADWSQRDEAALEKVTALVGER